MNEITVTEYRREIADVTRDIRIKTGQFLMEAIEIGRLLFEAKAMVEPGGWSKYIEEELPFSHSWANNYMKLYKELGSEQLTLFGNSQALMNLRPTHALELLSLPAESRDEFMENHDVENMSTRQLHQAVQAELRRSAASIPILRASWKLLRLRSGMPSGMCSICSSNWPPPRVPRAHGSRRSIN